MKKLISMEVGPARIKPKLGAKAAHVIAKRFWLSPA